MKMQPSHLLLLILVVLVGLKNYLNFDCGLNYYLTFFLIKKSACQSHYKVN